METFELKKPIPWRRLFDEHGLQLQTAVHLVPAMDTLDAYMRDLVKTLNGALSEGVPLVDPDRIQAQLGMAYTAVSLAKKDLDAALAHQPAEASIYLGQAEEMLETYRHQLEYLFRATLYATRT